MTINDRQLSLQLAVEMCRNRLQYASQDVVSYAETFYTYLQQDGDVEHPIVESPVKRPRGRPRKEEVAAS